MGGLTWEAIFEKTEGAGVSLHLSTKVNDLPWAISREHAAYTTRF